MKKYIITINSQSPRLYTVEEVGGDGYGSYAVHDERDRIEPLNEDAQDSRLIAALRLGLRAQPKSVRSGQSWAVEVENE